MSKISDQVQNPTKTQKPEPNETLKLQNIKNLKPKMVEIMQFQARIYQISKKIGY